MENPTSTPPGKKKSRIARIVRRAVWTGAEQSDKSKRGGIKGFLQQRKQPQLKKPHGPEHALGMAAPGEAARLVDDTGALKGTEAQLLSIFADERFDPAQFLQQHLSHLEVRGFENVCRDIADFSNSIQQEIIQTVRQNNDHFVTLCETVQTVEPGLARLNNVLNNSRALLTQLRQFASSDATGLAADDDSDRSRGASPNCKPYFDGGPIAGVPDSNGTDAWMRDLQQTWLTVSQQLSVSIAERQLHRVSRLLDAIERVLQASRDALVQLPDEGHTLTAHMCLQNFQREADQQRKHVIAILERTIQERSAATHEIQQNVRLITKLTTPVHALNSLLMAHELQMERFLQKHLNPNTTFRGEDGFEYSGAIAQRIFGTIGRAANDMLLIFRKESHQLSAAFTVWCLRLTERCATLLQQHALKPFAAPLGLETTMECVMLALVYCSCLEETHNICLKPHMLRVLWPYVQTVLDDHVHGACNYVKQAAMDDISAIVASNECAVSAAKQLSCTKVAAREAKGVMDQVLCLEAIELGDSVFQAVSTIFTALCDGICDSIQRSRAPNGRLPGVLERHATDIMESLAVVVEEKLPRHLSSSENKVGKLCNTAVMEAQLAAVADALDLEES